MAAVTDPTELEFLNQQAPAKGPITDPAEIAALEAQLKPDQPVTARGLGTAALGGAARGVAGTLGLGGDIANAIQPYLGYGGGAAMPPAKHFVGSEDLLAALPTTPQPQNMPERYAAGGAQGITSTILPGGHLKKLASLGLASGLGGEAGAQILGDTATGENTGRLAGSAVPLVAGLTGAGGPRAIAWGLSHLMPEGVTKHFFHGASKLIGGKDKASLGALAAKLAKSLFQQNLPRDQVPE